MRVLFLGLAAAGLCACSKSDSAGEERWLETSQRQEVIVFKDGLPDKDLPEEKSFYFQSRKLSPTSGQVNESGIYFYKLEGDSISLRSRDERYYFKMGNDSKSFIIGRFFHDVGGLPEKLEFERQ
ncbi:hypothetical protein ACFOTA_00330 [Chitinophaga sp. GCM10012297]|uniref:Lipoprotein n=1 Tax=Chitinophaga chungangae TaxID=2821488 RepID=A0ABS3Y7I8_9BACT|nr:hypothetical protein [Chitinophaga chungangae]MBO9150636.1 hypothetical protein [Chitinophaga chungangae]